MRKINEIFYSIQGEGHHTGVPSVFVRFSGCNLRCPFCDTNHEEGELLSDDEIIRRVNQFPQARWIVLTGGEPSLWIDGAFVRKLKQSTGKLIAIETNGTNMVPNEIDWITVSPKAGISTVIAESDVTGQTDNPVLTDSYQTPEEWIDNISVRPNNPIGGMESGPTEIDGKDTPRRGIRLPIASELKVVDVGQNLDWYFRSPWVGRVTIFYLQPCYDPDPAQCALNLARTVARVLANPKWRLSLQTHRYIGIK